MGLSLVCGRRGDDGRRYDAVYLNGFGLDELRCGDAVGCLAHGANGLQREGLLGPGWLVVVGAQPCMVVWT
jgi:hypothetical protein